MCPVLQTSTDGVLDREARLGVTQLGNNDSQNVTELVEADVTGSHLPYNDLPLRRKDFHETVLFNGAMPLAILEESVTAWIEEQKGSELQK